MHKKQIIFNDEKFCCSKTRLLKNEFENDIICKSSSMILLKKKLNSFNQFQFVFNRAFFLIHFDFKRDFFIDIDVLKKNST